MKAKISFTIFILVAAFAALSVTSCTKKLNGTQTAEKFLNLISHNKFSEAYKLTDSECSEADFTQMYTSFWSELEITSLSYKKISEFNTDVYSVYECEITYHSSLCEDITNNYSITVTLNDKNIHNVKWTPSLIVPEMEYGDTIKTTTLTAKRGDIICDGALVATNEPVIAVSLKTEGYTQNQIKANAQFISTTLNIPESDVLEKVYVYVSMYTQNYKDSSGKTVYSKEDVTANIKLLSEALGEQIYDLEAKAANAKDGIAEIGTYFPVDIDMNKLSNAKGIVLKTSNYNGVSLIKEYAPNRLSDDIQSLLKEQDGITVEKSAYSTMRTYPYGSLLAHTVGYTQAVSQKEVDKLNEGRTKAQGLYTTASRVGVAGLEKSYETELRGSDGYRIYLRSQTGQNKRTFAEQKAQDGLDIELSINLELQQKTEALLANTLYGNEMGGAVIVMDPKTGEVQAMASYPTYDVNLFGSGMTQQQYEELEQQNAPFFNRAVSGYAPGSVFKPITAAAALHYEVLSLNYEFTGTIEDDHWKPVINGVPLDIKRTHVKRRNTPLNMRNAIIHSDNIYFANAALKLGEERLEEYWNSLGLNERIPFDISISASQYKSLKEKDENERTLQTFAETGYGQGTMLVTPIQIASVYCAFSNGGDIPVPYIVEGLYKTEGNSYTAVKKTTPTIWRKSAISSYICSKLTNIMKDVVSPLYNGTGQKLQVKNCVVAGKTGTAEVIKNKKDNSWFIGYRTDVTAKDERLVLVVLDVPVGEQYTELKLKIARNLLEIENSSGEN